MASPTALITLVAFIVSVHAGFSPSSAETVVIYWGQNSRGISNGADAQQDLAGYCANSSLDVVPLAFDTAIHGVGGEPEINFSNAGNNCSIFPDTNLLNCSQLGKDIATCQQTYSKTILLSIGGATYSEGGFSSASDAVAGANTMWATFGPQQANSSAFRPFGSSAVDGFDLDFEATVNNMVPFANQLRNLMDADRKLTGKSWLLTAAPQCPYPDQADNSMLDGAVFFDAIWVQFYNNYCGLQSFQVNSSTQVSFNFATWDHWARCISKNRSIKVFLGVPGSSTAAGSGYVSASDLAQIIDYCQQFSSFGGVMIWDASQVFLNGNFLSTVKSTLVNASKQQIGLISQFF